MPSRSEELNRILRGLQAAMPDIEASALIAEDGLPLASALPGHYEESRVAGLSTTLLGLGARAAAELERGPVEQIVIRGAHGCVVMVGAAPGTMLLVLTRKDAKLGLLFLDLARAVEAIKKIL
jgi:predicted regulator of Ras-like GTPase activity (Roadblock/LC7/MglB family)